MASWQNAEEEKENAEMRLTENEREEREANWPGLTRRRTTYLKSDTKQRRNDRGNQNKAEGREKLCGGDERD